MRVYVNGYRLWFPWRDSLHAGSSLDVLMDTFMERSRLLDSRWHLFEVNMHRELLSDVQAIRYPPPCLSIFCILLKTRERKYLCGTFLEGLLAFVEVFAVEFGFGIVPSALIAEHVRIVYHVKRVFMFGMPFRGCPVCHGMPLAGGPQGVTSLQISVFLSWENGLFFSRGCILFALPSITII